MEDRTIVELYWSRDEQAIAETEKKYGNYCRSIAQNILRNQADTEECVNDTWLHTWNSLPPQRPQILSAYLGTITRNLSLSRYRSATAQKRGASKLTLAYDELSESIPDNDTAETQVILRELGKTIDCFLRTLPQKDYCIFLRRYWYMDTTRQIAQRYHMAEGSVKVKLHRTRAKLKKQLEQEGYRV